MGVRLKKTAWYVRSYKYAFPNRKLDKSLCPFFWWTLLSFVVVMIKYPITKIGWFLFEAFKKVFEAIFYVADKVCSLFANDKVEPWVDDPTWEHIIIMSKRIGNPFLSDKKLEAYQSSIDKHLYRLYKIELCEEVGEAYAERFYQYHNENYVIYSAKNKVTDEIYKLREAAIKQRDSFIMRGAFLFLSSFFAVLSGHNIYEGQHTTGVIFGVMAILMLALCRPFGINILKLSVDFFFDVAVPFAKAKYEKVCPLIKWED